MTSLTPIAGPTRDPISMVLAATRDAVLAVIVGVEGPSYRPVGAMMAITADGDRAGTLSSGCIESDIALHAAEALERGMPATLRYGRGSPFVDIQLPCGGGLDILLVPRPDAGQLAEVAKRRTSRTPCTLEIDTTSGAMRVLDEGETDWSAKSFRARFTPDLRFLVFGKGPEASTFAGLVQSAGYPNLLLSPDLETLESATDAGSATRHLVRPSLPADVQVDAWTSIILFFHDHDWEPPILVDALKTPAFYVGSQGSQRARDARMMLLEAMDVPPGDMARLHGPVGLIPSARDAGTLAVSVLAEILSVAMKQRP